MYCPIILFKYIFSLSIDKSRHSFSPLSNSHLLFHHIKFYTLYTIFSLEIVQCQRFRQVAAPTIESIRLVPTFWIKMYSCPCNYSKVNYSVDSLNLEYLCNHWSDWHRINMWLSVSTLSCLQKDWQASVKLVQSTWRASTKNLTGWCIQTLSGLHIMINKTELDHNTLPIVLTW